MPTASIPGPALWAHYAVTQVTRVPKPKTLGGGRERERVSATPCSVGSSSSR